MARIFIDGAAGTTGLQVHDRLKGDAGIELIILGDDERKSDEHRQQAMSEADITILCLPDDAARNAADMAAQLSARIIDASTAHRTAPDFTYGFAELEAGQAERIASSDRVSNPGCYPTGFLALVRPLVDSGVISADTVLPIAAVSGYTGGGKAMIARYEQGQAPAFTSYGLGLAHKHLPEMKYHGHLQHHPIFLPSVGDFAQGMLVNVMLPSSQFERQVKAEDITGIWAERYQNSPLISTPAYDEIVSDGFLAADRLAGTDRLELSCFHDSQNSQFVLTAQLDNLGKGASGAAVQNMNLMLGRDEMTGLQLKR